MKGGKSAWGEEHKRIVNQAQKTVFHSVLTKYKEKSGWEIIVWRNRSFLA